MKSRIKIIVCMFIMLTIFSLAYAEEEISELTIVYKHDDIFIEGAIIKLYLIEDISIKELNEDELIILSKNIVTDNKKPIDCVTTDSRGEAHFNNIKDGIYLVKQEEAIGNACDYEFFNPYLLSLPYHDEKGKKNIVITYPKTTTKTKPSVTIPPNNPKTGDNLNISLLIFGIIVSIIIIFIINKINKKHKIS